MGAAIDLACRQNEPEKECLQFDVERNSKNNRDAGLAKYSKTRSSGKN
jgi:hypothetical protein